MPPIRARAELWSVRKMFEEAVLTGSLCHIGALDHGRARRCLPERDLGDDGVLFNDRPARNAEAVSCRGVILDDRAATFTADGRALCSCLRTPELYKEGSSPFCPYRTQALGNSKIKRQVCS
jgi:hypothetical protein